MIWHKILPETAFWAGGPEVSYDAEKFLTEMPEMTGVIGGRRRKDIPRSS